MRRLLLLAMLVSNPAIANPTQFDLVCAGEQQIYRSPAMRTEPFNETFHFDLNKLEYCLGSCLEVRKIQSMDSLQITLVETDYGRGTLAPVRDKRIIDRRSGTLNIDYLNGATLERLVVVATCHPQPFTAFPQTKF